jgi:signal peptidase II
VDQELKIIFFGILNENNANIVIIPNVAELVMVHNRGAAFGILQNNRWIFILFSVLAFFCFIYIIFIRGINDKLFIISSMLVVGGGVGNLIDRIFRGFVIDYIKLSFFPPVFNFADICISIGGMLLIVYVYLGRGSKVSVNG